MATIERRLTSQAGFRWIASESELTIADFCLGGFLCAVHANDLNPNFFTFSLIIGEYPRVQQYLTDFKFAMAEHLLTRPPHPM